MKRYKSEVVPCNPHPANPNGPYYSCALEFVPNSKLPREIFVLFDGRRIAERCPRGSGDWIPLVAGYEVKDENGSEGISVVFNGVPMQ
jgi:hypothetical protein